MLKLEVLGRSNNTTIFNDMFNTFLMVYIGAAYIFNKMPQWGNEED